MRTRLLVAMIALLVIANGANGNTWDYNGIVQNQTYQLEFTPRKVQNTTYWATMSVGPSGGYGGIQQLNSTNPLTDHAGIFSLWDSTDTNSDSFVIGYNPLLSFRNYSFRFGGEGTGAQMFFNWAWVMGKPYRMAWRRYVEPGNAMVRFEAFYFDPYDTNAAGWVWVGTIRRPESSDSGRNLDGFSSFTEDFGAGTRLVREIDIRNVWLLDLSNHWQNVTAARMTDPRDNAVMTAISGGWRHRCFDTNDVFTYFDNLPMLPASDLAPIYLPYRINCGWSGTNYTANLQVATSLNRAFEPDAFWYGISTTNYTANAINVAGVTNAAPALLYQSRREGTNFGYHLFGQQPGGLSLVRLHFAETDFNAVGARRQNVIVNGAIVETNLDIRASAGSQNLGLVRDYVVTVDTNGLLDIVFQSQTPGVPAIVSGIEVSSLISLSNVFSGVSQIISLGAPGPIVALTTNWIPIVGGDSDAPPPATFALARSYFSGRVVTMGHEGLFTDGSMGQLDNSRFAVNLALWLCGTGQRKAIYSTGHGEWLNGGNIGTLGGLLLSNGIVLVPAGNPLNATNLGSNSVLIVGNAWGSFTTNEIEAVRQWVANGGGLLLTGLGWSWSGATLDNYPMTQMAAPYLVAWFRGSISDPTDQISGTPIFHTFYPNLLIPAPIITKPSILANNGFSLFVSGDVGRQYRLQVSTNLANWSDAQTLVSTSSNWQLTNYLFTNSLRRFYRMATP